jgi:predicted nicotinamide N-methyase
VTQETQRIEGDDLVRELGRRFVTGMERVTLAGREVDLLKPHSAESLISEDDFEHDERLPYWADLWPSATVLASQVVRGPLQRVRVLELGCGLGLVTIAAMMAGAEVTATDYYEAALLFTRANAWRLLRREPATRLLDWRAMPDDVGPVDLVLAADVLDERPYAALVAEVIHRTMAGRGWALIADPGRIAAGRFLEECAARGLEVAWHQSLPYSVGSQRQTIQLHALSRGSRR